MYLNALTFYYWGCAAKRYGLPLIPRVCEALIFLLFNSSIPLAAEVGEGSRCGHRGVAVVIGPRARIGKRCLIRAHVVIGGGGQAQRGAPTIGDDVEIGAGAKILGPISVGDRAVIGANAVVVNDVPPDAVMVGVPARVVVRSSGEARDAEDEG